MTFKLIHGRIDSPMTDRSHLVHTVTDIRQPCKGTSIIRFERKDLQFQPGQHLSVGLAGDLNLREYSIYSSDQDPWLDIIVKEVSSGFVSPRLCSLKPGDKVYVEGPFGFFTLDRAKRQAPLLMIASGTGISPFRSMVRSHPGLDYHIVHGVRTLAERYDHDSFEEARMVSCVSREAGGNVQGRVTAWLKTAEISPDTQALLCGNCDMIYEAYDILVQKGLPPQNIAAEVYF